MTLAPFELAIEVQLFETRLNYDRRLAWETVALKGQKKFPDWNEWRKKIGPTAEDRAEEIRMAIESKELLDDHTNPGDEEALAAFVARRK